MTSDQTNQHIGISLVSVIVASYDEAIEFFTHKLGFVLSEDSPAISTKTGNPKRWVVVRPPEASAGSTGILIAQADGPEQEAGVGRQFAGRVGLFWHVRDFDATYARLVECGVQFTSKPRTESYGRVAVFLDVSGNKWDLLGP